MRLTCIIIDDEPLAVELLEGYVNKTPFLKLQGSYYSASSAFEAIKRSPVDLVFCDIQMPELSGMELARMLPERTKVVMTTAFSSYAVEGFRVNALDYLLKPISYNDFLEATDKALKWFEATCSSDVSAIFVKTEYRIMRIELNDILYIEGLKDYVRIHLCGKTEPVLTLMSMKALEESLPSDRFIRIHRSFIIQPSKMSYIERGRVVFDKKHIPVSDSYRQAFLDFLSTHSIFRG
ncbi:MAG TPA: LytTR family DNA-binding domain-containing protein [Candidatus Coprenecus stercoravium]|uniref:LytTR family DNA-binding domain-containing protein n=1 Tax=Candidatus Coprenecus stercoravium TaxID=2840735 RepID=A0A9D2GQR2_9BACT|nr:LytTR family DNA-binding domain-containing protein [Candidatus Coprenecus stercoravium]